MEFDLDNIVKVTCKIIREVHLGIQEEIIGDPRSAFEEALIGKRRKRLLSIDLTAEHTAAKLLRRRLNYNLLAIGEESIATDRHKDLSNNKELIVLMDMIDGTDLLERGLSNWCSALIFYYPPQRRILASLIGIPEDGVYYAMDGVDGAYKSTFNRESEPKRVNGPSDVKNLRNASIAFYGQKISKFLSVIRRSKFISYLEYLQNRANTKTRIYNLAGNPMMMKVIDGHTKIDAVFDLEGQCPHDVAPGAYIAQKAGAVFSSLDGGSIDLHKLLVKPIDPHSRVPYLLTSTKALSKDIRRYLS